jgi:hypothetical protein
MTNKKNVSSLLIDYTAITPAPKIVGMITVSSRNKYGYLVETDHFDEASAQRERAQRARQGHTEIS